MIRRPPRSTPFPTRRSSDLICVQPLLKPGLTRFTSSYASGPFSVSHKAPVTGSIRSEEHTSELQSQSNLVCRLLLEKKKALHSIAPLGLAGDFLDERTERRF